MNKQNILLAGLFLVIAIVVAFAISTSLSVIGSPVSGNVVQNSMGQKSTRMGLSAFDIELAKQFMDKNNDGKCDVCGMDVELCIDSGQLQCNMDSNSKIGVLGSQHIHADWKIYINGNILDDAVLESLAMDMSKTDNSITSSFIHLDKGAPAPEKTGDIIHMHATGVPLWVFFKSVGMDFNKDCIILENKESFCNNSVKKLKFYVNGKPNNAWENYVFNDLDKILISYGDETDLSQQLNLITNFAQNH